MTSDPSRALSRSTRARTILYWSATALVAAELGLGGAWDIARIPYVTRIVTDLGYPSYFLIVLGCWKVLGAAALLVPGRPLLKEWAYAGSVFVYTGAVASHLITGSGRAELGILIPMIALTGISWGLRPAGRRPVGSARTGSGDPGRVLVARP
jgi:hypothetical protein